MRLSRSSPKRILSCQRKKAHGDRRQYSPESVQNRRDNGEQEKENGNGIQYMKETTGYVIVFCAPYTNH